MSKLSEEERQMWESLRETPWKTPHSLRGELVKPTPETRWHYIQFMRSYSSLFPASAKPVRFRGDNWKL